MKKKTQNQQRRFRPKLKIKKGDTVVVIAGANKGEKGKVQDVFAVDNRAIVEGVNMVTKHLKPNTNQDMPDGGRVEIPAPIHISNLKLVDPKSGEPTRVGRKRDDDGSLKRFSKDSDEFID